MASQYWDYTSAARKRELAAFEKARLIEKGFNPLPVDAFSGPIASSAFGESWVDKIEDWADEPNRLGRGKTSLRAGSVVHLGINGGEAVALVQGGRLYRVYIKVAPISKKRKKILRAKSAQDPDIMMALLTGNYDADLAQAFCGNDGLLPAAREIGFSCSCPDYAGVCKHVAAALYGIARRIDSDPRLLFQLRGVEPEDLLRLDGIPADFCLDDGLEADRIQDIFGIELKASAGSELEEAAEEAAPYASAQIAGLAFNPKIPTGEGIKALRRAAGLSQEEMAKSLDITLRTLRRWESEKVPAMQDSSRERLAGFFAALKDAG